MRIRIGLLVLGLGVLGLVGHAASGADEKKTEDKKVDTRVFELRIYYAAPGKLTALNARFRDHTNKLLFTFAGSLRTIWTRRVRYENCLLTCPLLFRETG
jgi:hypothetical protein